VEALAHLVEAGADAHPDRIEEWRAYVETLGRTAAPDGTLPPRVDSLVWEVFAPLLEHPRWPASAPPGG
jgi:hypothetical protein